MNVRERVSLVLRDVKALPTLPDVAVKLLEMGEDPTSSARDLADVVQKDVSLATRVLKLVNSSFFGMRREVTSVQQALMILGIAKLRGLVLSGAAMDMFDRQGVVGSFSRAEFWKHSVATGAAARLMANRTRVADPEIAFTAGLIHDMGKIFIDRYLHPEFIQIVKLLETPSMTMSIAENSVLGVTHSDIGHHLAIYWNLPEVLREAIGHHHNPHDATSHPQMAALVAVADTLVRELNVGCGGGANREMEESILRMCNMDESDFAQAKEDVIDVLDEQVAMLAEAV